jgi:outer membrane lipoprotein-sorting protein
MKGKLWFGFTLLALLSLVLAGCGQRLTAEEIVAKMQETVENTQDAHAVVAAEANIQGIELSATAEVWEKAPGMVRAEVLEASEPSLQGSVLVVDGQQTWYYEPSSNRVLVGPTGQIETPLPQELIAGLQEVVQQVLDATDVALEREEEVAGRMAYVLTASPKEESGQELFPGNGTATLWVDKEQWIVLQATYEAGAFGSGTLQVRSFELNPGIDEGFFAFEVPEGATVVDMTANEPTPVTLDEARARAGFTLLVPDYVPAGATLVEVFLLDDGSEATPGAQDWASVVLRYNHSAEVSFAVVQGPELASPPPLGQTQDLTVRGQPATAITDAQSGSTFLYWSEGGVTITIGGHIGLDEALKVAESLE